MRCDRCGKDAFMEINVMSEKGNEVLHLCMDCYKNILSENNDIIQDYSNNVHYNESSKNIKDFLQYIFMNAFNIELTSDNSQDLLTVKNTICPKCNTSLEDYLHHDKLGCSECYNVFREQIRERLYNYNKDIIYIGDCPDEYLSYKELQEEYIDTNDEITSLLFLEDYENLKDKTIKLEEIKQKIKIMEENFHE